MRRLTTAVLATALLISGSALATTFVVPSDRVLVHRAHAIVVAEVLASYSQLDQNGGIETVTPMRVDDVLKGFSVPGIIDVHEPGGVWNGRGMTIAGTPSFTEGKKMILFLMATPSGTWAVWDLAVGKFDLEVDTTGMAVAVRQEADLVGFDSDLSEHRERRRSVEGFLNFIRSEVDGRPAPEDYFVKSYPILTSPSSASRQAPPTQPNVFTATGYSSDGGGASHLGARWKVFPAAVSWFTGTATEPGAAGGGVTAVQNSFTAWDGDSGSNVNYTYSGVDNGTHTNGTGAADGANTVLFERNLTGKGIAAFSCSPSSFSGVLGVGGPKYNIAPLDPANVVNGEQFYLTTEGDVEMNQGIAGCTLLFNSGSFDAAVAHELGHTLGFRHADQTRANNPGTLCTTDASLDCVPPSPFPNPDPPPGGTAIMRSSITFGLNATLQTWDQHCVDAIYPNVVVCVPVTIGTQPSSSNAASGTQRTISVMPNGTSPFTYQWYTGVSGNTASPIGGATNSTLTVSPAVTTSYWVRVTNGCGTADSTTATLTVSAGPFRGDANGSGTVDVPDIFFLISNLFSGGPAPTLLGGDANSSGGVEPGDIFFLINYLFNFGPGPA